MSLFPRSQNVLTKHGHSFASFLVFVCFLWAGATTILKREFVLGAFLLLRFRCQRLTSSVTFPGRPYTIYPLKHEVHLYITVFAVVLQLRPNISFACT